MSVDLKLGEVICDAATAKLQAGMSARVARINAQASDFQLDDIPNDRYHLGGIPHAGLPSGPAVIVAEGPMEIAPDTEGPHSFIAQTQLFVIVYADDASRATLDRKLKRYLRAVIETLWDDPPMQKLDGASPNGIGTAAVFNLVPLRTRPGPTSEPDTESTAWRSWMGVIFLAEQVEG